MALYRMLPILFLLVAAMALMWYFTRPTSKSVLPTPETAAIATASSGNLEVVPKVKYVELKKMSGGSMDVGLIGLFPKKSSKETLPASALTATASSELGSGYSANKVINYTDETSRWASKTTAQPGEWVRVELKEPTALDRIMILNGLATPGSNVASARMLGTQVSILDADSKPIKTYIIAEPSLTYMFDAR